MTRIIIKEFVWDEYNLEHIKKHKVTQKEVEQATEIIYHRRTYDGKYLMTSRIDKRILTLIIRRKGLGKYYVVSARDASR